MAKIVKRTLSWSPSAATDLAGYRLYWAIGANATIDYDSNHVDLQNVTGIVIPDDVPSVFPLAEPILSIGVSAFDVIGNESDITVVQNVPFDFVAPDAPTNLVVGTLF